MLWLALAELAVVWSQGRGSYHEVKGQIIKAELLLLKELGACCRSVVRCVCLTVASAPGVGFNVHLEHPHKFVLNYAKVRRVARACSVVGAWVACDACVRYRQVLGLEDNVPVLNDAWSFINDRCATALLLPWV